MADTSLSIRDHNTGDIRTLKLKDNGDGTYALDVNASISVPAPEGGATEAKQDAEIALLTTIESNQDTANTALSGISTKQDTTNTNIGATTDAVITTDTTGSLSGKLRGLVKWAYERMPASLGAKTAANSFPVTLASDGIGTTSTPIVIGGAVAHDAADSGNPLSLGATVVAAPIAVNDGDRVRLRATNRGAIQTSDDWSRLVLTSSAPNPTGNDVIMAGAGTAPASGDFQIRDTAAHSFYIPIMASGWRNVTIWIRITATFDQNLTLILARANQNGTTILTATNTSGTIAASNAGPIEVATSPTISALTGTLTANGSYSYTAAAEAPFVMLRLTAAGIPTTGNVELWIDRRS